MITKINVKNKEYIVLNCAVEITYIELKALRDNSKLVAGTNYIITDYEFTTTTAGTGSAGHQFDVIVVADSPNTLNENARARKHEGDSYFAECNLSAWELKYCIDNDKMRFDWADEENGKGVIFYMKDEHNNECPYDFKNLIYQVRKGFVYNQWGTNYTFSRDESLDVTLTEKYPAGPGLYCGYRCASTPSAWSDNICYTYGEATLQTTSLFNSSLSLISYGGSIVELKDEEADFYTFNEGNYDDDGKRYFIDSTVIPTGSNNNVIEPTFGYNYNENGQFRFIKLNNIYVKSNASYCIFLENCFNIDIYYGGKLTFINCNDCIFQQVYTSTFTRCSNIVEKNGYFEGNNFVNTYDMNCELSQVRNCDFTNCGSITFYNKGSINNSTFKNCNEIYLRFFSGDGLTNKHFANITYLEVNTQATTGGRNVLKDCNYFDVNISGQIIAYYYNSSLDLVGVMSPNNGETWSPAG